MPGAYCKELESVHEDTVCIFGPQNISKHVSCQGQETCCFAEVTPNSLYLFPSCS